MTETFKFDLVSPERLLMSANADQVIVPGAEGDFTVLPKHAPFISTLRPGVLTASAGGAETRYFVRGGFAEVGPDELTVLAETAMPLSELTDSALAEQIRVAQDDVANAADDDTRFHAIDVVERLSSLRDTLKLA
ncbi:MAG: F0F1 ATP synthase subunit epsilon [Hyphomicrobiales bacterium]|nr:F0F1 ATP synthase subunit epsilon [Hyphomicrobiales bacterium]